MSDSEAVESFASFSSFLSQYDSSYIVEFHHWRDFDNSVIDEYREKVQDYKRGGEFAKFMRNEYADYFLDASMTNDVCVVVSKKAYSSSWFSNVKNGLKQQTKVALEMEGLTEIAIKILSGSHICTHNEYLNYILRTFNKGSFELDKK